MSTNMTFLTDVAMITCLVQTGDADLILKAARESGATAALVHQGRGIGIRERLGLLGIAVDAEKDVVNVLVSSDQAEIVANNIFKAGQFDSPGRGYLYITPLDKAATYLPESLKERLRKKGSAEEES